MSRLDTTPAQADSRRKKMKRVQILLTKKQFEYLKEFSDNTGESMASIIRRAIESMKTTTERNPPAQEWRRPASASAG